MTKIAYQCHMKMTVIRGQINIPWSYHKNRLLLWEAWHRTILMRHKNIHMGPNPEWANCMCLSICCFMTKQHHHPVPCQMAHWSCSFLFNHVFCIVDYSSSTDHFLCHSTNLFSIIFPCLSVSSTGPLSMSLGKFGVWC